MAIKRKTNHRMPSSRQFLPAINTKDLFKRVIRMHQLTERALMRGISKRLFRPDALDMKAMAFPLKVSLALALGVVPSDYGPPLLKINAIRNAFAHDPDARLEKERAIELWNCVQPALQNSIKDSFKQRFSLKPRSIKVFAGRKLRKLVIAPE